MNFFDTLFNPDRDEARAILYSFMIRSEVAGWALIYARKINQLDQVSEFDGNDPAYHRYDRDCRAPRHPIFRRKLVAGRPVP